MIRCVSNYQILQRNSDGIAVAVMGGNLPEEAGENKEVYVCAFRETDNLIVVNWQKAERTAKDWHAEIQLPEGGPYRLDACLTDKTSRFEWEKRILCIHHVGVGDLYILAGQSNMAGYGRDIAYDPPCMGVHLYANNGKWDIATHPLNDPTDTIYPETAEYNSGTSPALSFGRRLKEALGIPIGLVQASLGGSTLDRWHPQEEGSLYRSMLRRLDAVGKVKGALWYQGCSDAKEVLAGTYQKRFCEMVDLWRKELGEIPFLTVQLNRWGESKVGDDRYWGLVKEAQRQAALQRESVYVVPSYDVTMSDGIHNSSGGNVVLGERLALTALQMIYHKPGKTAASVMHAEYVDDTHIRLRFAEGFHVIPTDRHADGMHVEDAQGLAECLSADWEPDDSVLVTAKRPFVLPAKYHAFWQENIPPFIPRDTNGMPMLACYGIDIEKK